MATTAVVNIAVLLVPFIIPVLLIILSWAVFQLQDKHSLTRRHIMGGTIQLAKFLLAVCFGMFFMSFLLLV